MVEVTRRDGAVQGWTVGLAVGLGKFVARTLVGVYELVTAPFAAPPGFEPILEPEFPWGYFDDPPS
jgi:putative exosortase-associated protein (TIGR04073 family)